MIAKKVQDFITSKGLLKANDKLLLAVSGGKDSVAMARVLSELGYTMAIAHCNFQLRGEDSDRDELFVRELASELKVSFYSIKFNTQEEKQKGESTQMVARRLRYNWFDSLMQSEGFDKLATAHTANDNSETIIYNLTKGTGLKGIRGIQASAEHLVRPLLSVTSSEVMSYLKENGYSHREDVSNASDTYARNKIRHHVIPSLLEINESLHAGMQTHYERFDDILAFVEHQSAALKQVHWIKKEQKTEIDISALRRVPGHKSVLYYWLSPLGFTQSQIEDALRAEESGRQFNSDNHVLLVDREHWLLSDNYPKKVESLFIKKPEGELGFLDTRLEWKTETSFPSKQELIKSANAFLNLEKLAFPLTLRKWEHGDVFQPFGMTGRKLVSDYLIDHKVNQFKKESTMVLLSENEIVWLVGHRVSAGFAIDADCKKTLHFQVLKND